MEKSAYYSDRLELTLLELLKIPTPFLHDSDDILSRGFTVNNQSIEEKSTDSHLLPDFLGLCYVAIVSLLRLSFEKSGNMGEKRVENPGQKEDFYWILFIECLISIN